MYYTELVAKIIYWIIIVPFCTSMMLVAAVVIPLGLLCIVNWLLEKLFDEDFLEKLFEGFAAPFILIGGSILVGAFYGIKHYWLFPVFLWSVLMSEDYIVFTVAGSLAPLVILRTLGTLASLRRERDRSGESNDNTFEQIQETLIDMRKSVKSQEQIQETLEDTLEQIQETLVDIRGSVKSQNNTFSFYRL